MMNAKELFNMVADYFKDEKHSLTAYEPVGVIPCSNETDNYLYKVMAQYIGNADYKKGTYAVWTAFNTSTGSMNYGHYDMAYEDAMELFKGTEKKPISWDRLSELATKFKDYVSDNMDYFDSDKEGIYQFFKDEYDMTDDELEYFGIEKPKKYKRVRAEVEFHFDFVIPEDETEDDYVEYYEVNLADILADVGSSSISTDVVEEDINRSRAESLLNNYCYGDLDYES